MPRKSRRTKIWQSKRKQIRQISSPETMPQTSSAAIHKPATPSELSVPTVSRRATSTTRAVIRYPYVVAELRRIGILAGIILATLILLALVLS